MSDELPAPDSQSIPGLDWQKYYAAVGMLTARWAEYERLIDITIWELAEVEPTVGACITSQLPSVHARFRTLVSLLGVCGAPAAEMKAVSKLGNDSAALVMVRNRYAHNPTTFGLNDDMTDWQFFMNVIQAQNKLTFELKAIDLKDIYKTIDDINSLGTKIEAVAKRIPEWRTIRRM